MKPRLLILQVEKKLEYVNIMDDIESYINNIDIKNKKELTDYIKEIYSINKIWQTKTLV